MPAVEAQEDVRDSESATYEWAFHILPTTAEEEVPNVFERLRALVERVGGTITNQEAPEFYDLAYEVTKQVEGVNRRFNAAYFGWIRFSLTPEALERLQAEIAHTPEILRFLLIRLTRAEEEQPFSVFAVRREREAARAPETEEEALEEDEIPEG